MLGSGMMWTPSLNWRVLDHFMRKSTPASVNLMSRRDRCQLQLKEGADAATKFDLRRKEKNAVVNKAQRAA